MATPFDELRDMFEAERATCSAVTLDRERLRALLQRCRPFVYRAANPSKVPHEQDKADALALLSDLHGF